VTTLSASASVDDRASSVRLALTLGIAGLISGLALAGAYEATLPRITAKRAEALRRAVLHVVPASMEQKHPMMKRMTIADGALIEAKNAAKPTKGKKTTGPVVYGVFGDDSELLGYAIPAQGPGFQDVIKLIYGFDPKKQLIIGLEILESRETPGLGDKIYKDAEFARNFDALAVTPAVVVVKHGKKTAPHQVDAITGATISSTAVTKIIAKSNETWIDILMSAQGSQP